ncbi:MAG: hypothetical protein KC516_04530 [Nanoarchaeota archaeon]|nr:hypothetical protein [Nanoarchaeota archaeon]
MEKLDAYEIGDVTRKDLFISLLPKSFSLSGEFKEGKLREDKPSLIAYKKDYIVADIIPMTPVFSSVKRYLIEIKKTHSEEGPWEEGKSKLLEIIEKF